jgi:hypothetical protein
LRFLIYLENWQFLEVNPPLANENDPYADPDTFTPILYRPWIPAENDLTFEDFLLLDDLYASNSHIFLILFLIQKNLALEIVYGRKKIKVTIFF